ncbi:hypothetical protein LOD99_52 [Oopsacas minuta]|uniref:Uncharacterized protein n=1 Tax=Oopsacas minuta TaxID=111878 RepID=A0AAV7KB43_9METZ|nr:hypothetical protein LOD99_52 [Oopsacas minuta]
MASIDCENISNEQENYQRRVSEFSYLVNQGNPQIVNALPERVKSRVIEHLSTTDATQLDEPISIIKLPSKEKHPYLYYSFLPLYVTYRVAHYMGGKLAWFFGITSPAYQDTIDMMEEQLEREESIEN